MLTPARAPKPQINCGFRLLGVPSSVGFFLYQAKSPTEVGTLNTAYQITAHPGPESLGFQGFIGARAGVVLPASGNKP
jgi:hypothetical protein